jgi:predicted nucleotidyltransferase
MSEHVVDVASAIRAGRYKDAVVAFAAGSIVRGEGTSFSDLDLVVVYARLPCAYRESFNFSGYPVEAFVHDPETLEYFFLEIDKPSGIPALAQMVVEGVEIPGPSEISRELKRRAEAIISAGPPAIDRDGEQRMRYAVSDGLDDLRAPRSRDEMIAAAGRRFPGFFAEPIRSCVRHTATPFRTCSCGASPKRSFDWRRIYWQNLADRCSTAIELTHRLHGDGRARPSDRALNSDRPPPLTGAKERECMGAN